MSIENLKTFGKRGGLNEMMLISAMMAVIFSRCWLAGGYPVTPQIVQWWKRT